MYTSMKICITSLNDPYLHFFFRPGDTIQTNLRSFYMLFV